MVHYLERLVEKWQSRRKTLKISSQKPIDTVENQQQQQTKEMEINQKKAEEAANAEAQANRDEETKLRTIQEDEEVTQTSRSALSKKVIPNQKQQLRQTAPEQTLILCPTLLYASICLILLLALSNNSNNQNSLTVVTTVAAASSVPQIQPPANNPFQSTQKSPLSALTSLSLGLIQQLATNQRRERWAHVPSPPPENSRDRPRPPTRNRGQMSQAIQRLRNRIGARNTIRVHNAFRDFAWRVLSSLSMPTPVIYEIRRQHLYTPEDDQMNDMLYAKNTSRTIRSKRFLDLFRHQDWQWFNNSANGLGDSVQQEANTMSRSDSDDDDDDSLRQRAKDKLLEVIRPRSRRSLLGNALRLPSIFPFKRHQEDSDKTKTSKRRNSFLRRRRKKESDRQMITIDGKQYYVDDDGKLKEVKDDEEIPDK